MTSALIYSALLGVLAIFIWLAARKSARTEIELDYVKRANESKSNSNKIVQRYVNMSSAELSERVRNKRDQYKRGVHRED